MRRITSACLLQTMRFDTLNDVTRSRNLKFTAKKLEKKGTKYVIESKETESDGAIVVKIRKQYNAYKVDGYMEG